VLPVSNSPRNNGSNRDRARSTASALRLIFAGLILPVFVYRHYIQDKGLVVFITHRLARY